MKNPLNKRLIRELRQDIGKYIVILILLIASIGFVSGFLVADGSMMVAYNESFTKYNMEDGNFTVLKKLNKAQKKAIESYGVTLYENFYGEEVMTSSESTLRIFKNREEVNLVCLMDGRLPQTIGEIALDRMYANNNHIEIGDSVTSQNKTWVVTGLVALSDYSALFSNNNDTMFDSVQFGVGIVSSEDFEQFASDELTFDYAWKYMNEPKNTIAEKELSDDFMKNLSHEIKLKTYIPRYQNQAINFTGEDMGSDRGMMIVLLYIIIAIMAFVFGITTSNTITKEANVIGTLRASGYTRGELVRHYMTVPVIVTLVGAFIGNILGYTVMKEVCAGMYYGSYSLPTYVTVWSGEAFILTTIVPILMMTVINWAILAYKMQLSPLKFLRRDLTRRKQKRALPLSHRIPFFSRFRLRIVLQNMSNYVILLLGIFFANLLLIFGLGMPVVLDNYQENMKENLLSNYQYMLQIPIDAVDEEHKLESMLNMLYFSYSVQTENEDAEKFSAYSLKTKQNATKDEEILLYGVEPNSKYVPIETEGANVYVSSAYADKYGIKIGDEMTLHETYEDKTYTLKVTDIYNYDGALNIFMSREMLNELFDLGDDYFVGYFSNTEITDIDKKYIGSVIDIDALTKVSRQLDVSMGNMMLLVDAFAVLIFFVLMYLLSKIIIEKNAQSISLTKILGYSNLEISRLYIISTTIIVALCIVISLPLVYQGLLVLFRYMMLTSMTGWIPVHVDNIIFIKIFIMGMAAYGAVAILEYRRIQKVPMDTALKNVE